MWCILISCCFFQAKKCIPLLLNRFQRSHVNSYCRFEYALSDITWLVAVKFKPQPYLLNINCIPRAWTPMGTLLANLLTPNCRYLTAYIFFFLTRLGNTVCGHYNDWVCPPVCSIVRILRHKELSCARGTLIIPLWKSWASWNVCSNNFIIDWVFLAKSQG